MRRRAVTRQEKRYSRVAAGADPAAEKKERARLRAAQARRQAEPAGGCCLAGERPGPKASPQRGAKNLLMSQAGTVPWPAISFLVRSANSCGRCHPLRSLRAISRIRDDRAAGLSGSSAQPRYPWRGGSGSERQRRALGRRLGNRFGIAAACGRRRRLCRWRTTRPHYPRPSSRGCRSSLRRQRAAKQRVCNDTLFSPGNDNRSRERGKNSSRTAREVGVNWPTERNSGSTRVPTPLAKWPYWPETFGKLDRQ